jgi:hypothetical protein
MQLESCPGAVHQPPAEPHQAMALDATTLKQKQSGLDDPAAKLTRAQVIELCGLSVAPAVRIAVVLPHCLVSQTPHAVQVVLPR